MNDPLSDRQAVAYGATGSAAPSASAAPESHFLAVKLLRLSRPTLSLGAPQHSFLSMAVPMTGTSDAPSSPTPSVDLIGSPEPAFLTLPTSFGNIYLGEALDFSLHINHDGLPQLDPLAYQVAVKVELQTTNTRASLLDVICPQIQLGASAHWPVHHDVRELGMHILVVQVTYNSGKYLRKFYKFNALNPFQVKTKTTPMPHGRVLLELAVQNLAQAPVALTRAALVPNTGAYQCRDVLPSSGDAPDAGATDDQGVTYLMPMDIRQFLFLFTSRAISPPSTPTTGPPAGSSSLPPLGRLELEWEGAASAGRLQTPPLPRKPGQGDGDLEVSGVAVPRAVPVGQPFAITLGIANNTRMTASLTATFLDTPDFPAPSLIPTRPPVPGVSAPLSKTHQGSPMKSTSISLASVQGRTPGGRASPSPHSPPNSPARRPTSASGHRRTGSLTAFRQSLGGPGSPPGSSTTLSPSPSNAGVSPADTLPGAPLALSLLHQVTLPRLSSPAGPGATPMLLVLGASQVGLPDVPAGGTGHVTLRAVGVRAGVLRLPRVRLVDALTGVAREVDPRVSVWVGGVGPVAAERGDGQSVAVC